MNLTREEKMQEGIMTNHTMGMRFDHPTAALPTPTTRARKFKRTSYLLETPVCTTSDGAGWGPGGGGGFYIRGGRPQRKCNFIFCGVKEEWEPPDILLCVLNSVYLSLLIPALLCLCQEPKKLG